jgi:hypothetical protein
MEGVSAGAVAAFCDAIEFGIHEELPTAGEIQALRMALRRIVMESQASGLTPERMLIGLKTVWIKVCHRHPAPDMHDATWHIVLRESLDAWHRQ